MTYRSSKINTYIDSREVPGCKEGVGKAMPMFLCPKHAERSHTNPFVR